MFLVTVYSFPQNNLEKEASSNVFYRPGFHVGDVLTITLPAPVARFNVSIATLFNLQIMNLPKRNLVTKFDLFQSSSPPWTVNTK